MSKFESLDFAPLPVAPPATPETVKVSVLKGGKLRVTLNAAAFEKLDEPDAFSVETAGGESKDGFLRCSVVPEGEGWPVIVRAFKDKRSSASCTIAKHPFKPGVTHDAVECDVEWQGGGVFIVALPDWTSFVTTDESEPAE